MEKGKYWPLTEGTMWASVFGGVLVFGATSNFGLALLACLLVCGVGIGLTVGWLQRQFIAFWPYALAAWGWVKTRILGQKERDPASTLYDVLLGHDPLTGRAALENLGDLKNIGVYGATRFGKTTWLHGVIHWLIGHHSPEELRLAISDPKETDYSIYGSLPHLLCPIATDEQETERLVELLLKEMTRRINLFKRYSTRHLCNDIHRYYELSGHRLPRIVAIFDELADSVQVGETEAKLIALAKKGQAYGITLIVGTQRPSAAVVNGELKSQLATTLCTFMPNNREYGVVAMIPKELYERMTPTRGLFMVYTPASQWRFIANRKIEDKALEARAAKLSGNTIPLTWGRPGQARAAEMEKAAQDNRKLRGSAADKIRMVQEWFATLERKPKASDFMAYFNVAEPTALDYIRKYWDDRVKRD